MNGQNKLIIILSVVVGVLFFIFVGLAVSYYTSNLMARSANIEKVEEKSPNLSKDSSDKKPIEDVNKKGEDSKREPVYNIGIEETAFRQQFNRVADDELSELNLHLTRKYVYNGDFASVYQTPFDSTTSLLVSFEPDTELVRGVFLSGKPVTDDETILFLGAIADIVATLNPDLTPSGRKSLLQNLGMFDGKHTDYRTVNKSTYRNNIHYKLQGTGGNGVAFLAVAKDIGTEAGSSVRRDTPYNIMADVTNYIVWDYGNQEQFKTSGSQNSEPDIKHVVKKSNADIDSEMLARIVLTRFHSYITDKYYREAFNCLSKEFQSSIDYHKWVDGFRTTVSSSVSNVKVDSNTSDKIVLSYILMAYDNPGGMKDFNGQVTLIKEDDEWKIDDIINKKMD